VRLRSQWWAIALLASLLVIVLTVDRTLLRLDNAVYDHLLQITPAGLSPGRSAASSSSSPSSPMLVGLDDESIERLGRWPWSRSVHAALIERLQQAGARAIAYDVLFTEPGDPDDDARLAAALGRASAGGRRCSCRCCALRAMGPGPCRSCPCARQRRVWAMPRSSPMPMASSVRQRSSCRDRGQAPRFRQGGARSPPHGAACPFAGQCRCARPDRQARRPAHSARAGG
jgi:hypothetical protein